MGITRVEELESYDSQLLSEKFGKMGIRMKQMENELDFAEIREKKA